MIFCVATMICQSQKCWNHTTSKFPLPQLWRLLSGEWLTHFEHVVQSLLVTIFGSMPNNKPLKNRVYDKDK